MKQQATAEEFDSVKEKARAMGCASHGISDAARQALVVTGPSGALDPEPFRSLPGVADARHVSQPFKLVSREAKEKDSVIDVGGSQIGGKTLAVMAGPCSVETEEQILEAAFAVKKVGATFLRGGAYKPRTSPYEFQGLREEGLRLLALAREKTGLRIVTEVKDTQTVPLVAEYADMLQVGARSMNNFSLLEQLGKLGKPVLLKRGPGATLKELLMAAEYILAQGNDRVALCERGIRTFETLTRNTLDINAVPVLKSLSHLPVVVDPSHGIGIRQHVPAIARAGVAAGADGLIIEVHPCPEKAWSDGHQSLSPPEFERLMGELQGIARAMGREG
jgi:3-deoxy-7-phosphoheptulonate synthase